MQKRQLGQSELYVTEMGLGCMSLGTDEKKARDIIDAALEEGINYFDTADLYDFGMNEEIIGRALKPYRDKIILATKGGNRWNKDKTSWKWDASAAYIKEAVKNSLKRLQTDYIDLFQLHGGTMEDPIDETIAAFEDLKEEGIIREYGISSIRPNVVQTYANQSSISSVMMQYSLLDRRPEEWLPSLHQKQISVIARGPLAKGLLSEKMLEKANEKTRQEGYLDYSYEELEQVLPAIKEFFSSRPMNEIAFRYLLDSEAVTSVIPGASTIQQLRENARAVTGTPLTSEEIEWLRRITKLTIYKDHRV